MISIFLSKMCFLFFFFCSFFSSCWPCFTPGFSLPIAPPPVVHLCLLPQYVLNPLSFVPGQVLGTKTHVLFSRQIPLPFLFYWITWQAQHFMLLFSFTLFPIKAFFVAHLLDSLPSTVFRAHILQPWHMEKKDLLPSACQICTNSCNASSEREWFTLHAPCWNICVCVDFSPKLKLHQSSRNFRGLNPLLQDIY